MCPPTSLDISPDINVEDIFISLEKIMGGLPLPDNVIPDVDLYHCLPSNLPENIWFLIHTKENENLELGNWKVKGEDCRLFSNSVITRWRTTLEFFEGPHEDRIYWLMQQYWITQQGRDENIKGASSLCRVFLGGEIGLDHGRQQELPGPCIPSSNSILQKGDHEKGNGSTREHEVNKDDEIAHLTVTGNGVEFPSEIDCVSGGDYLELRDLDTPASHSSSSDNSSRLSMSSDECFDMASLGDLESDNSKDLARKDASCKFNVTTPVRPDDLVALPASPDALLRGPVLSIEGNMPTKEETHRTDLIIPGSDNGCKDPDGKVSPHTVGNQGIGYGNEGPSSICHDVGTSSASQILSEDGKRKAANNRKKKLKKKYLCFVPFYFLF